MQHTQHNTTPGHAPISLGSRWLALLLCLMLPTTPVLAGEITLYYPDASGSPVAAADMDGNIIWREHYQPYGEKLNEPCPAPCNTPADYVDVGYTGHEYDAETGLTYMQARYYDPEVGRFLAIDPVGFKPDQPMTFNRYSYANNNPYRFTDPNGESAMTWQQAGRLLGTRAATAGAVAAADGPLPVGDVLALGLLVGTAVEIAIEMNNESADTAGNSEGNTNPYDGPVDESVVVVDSDGNAIPVESGEQITSSPDGDYQQVRDSEGNQTGTRLDKGGHSKQSDPKAQNAHGHRPGITDEKGNPHLPLKKEL